MKLYAITNGKKKDLENVSDEAFSQKMMGDGIAIMSDDGCIYAPESGSIQMVFPTHHAIGLKTDEGIEVLIHIGIDTVEMNGDGFESFVNQGDHVKRGDLLVRFDVDKVIQAGYEPDVIVIITNTHQYQTIQKTLSSTLTVQDVLLEIE